MILYENELKGILKDIKNGRKIEHQEEQAQLIKSMIIHIGSLDSELRDELIYGTFYEWILEKNLINHTLLKELLNECINHLLYKGIEENESDLVFTRSFTSLLIALILNRDNQDDFLSAEIIAEVKEKLVAYLSEERDVRGYVPVKGWAHSVAHMADTIDDLVKNPKLNRIFFIQIVNALWSTIIFQANHAFIHDEDERLLAPIFAMLELGLQEREIVKLLRQLPNDLTERQSQLDEQHYRILLFNCKTFLKSFYIQTCSKPQHTVLHKSIEACLEVL